ncbi:hypothetical protein EVAR_13981_1 [Eumeta japonica]|uniref:Uncharacterized protein n=1 Tax=Eumeta variegata TaxID=151549 RepID=A0A4C1U9C8_EUMVA|nr:hypothetical protein EVAR_13981_1 [Eumeta japonica]
MEEQPRADNVEENRASIDGTEPAAALAGGGSDAGGSGRDCPDGDTLPRDAILLILDGSRFMDGCRGSRGRHRRRGGRMARDASDTSGTSSSDSDRSRSRSRGRRSRSRSRGGRSRSRSRGRSRCRSRRRSRSRSRGGKCKSHHKKKLHFKCKNKWGKFKPKFKGHHGRKFMVWV